MNQHRDALRAAYDFDATRRNANTLDRWRVEVIDDFLTRTGSGSAILDLGAGTGQNAAYMSAAGHPVVAVDLSPTSVRMAQSRNVDARVGDFTDPDFHIGEFDGVLAMNSLLHVEKALFPTALGVIRRSLRIGGIALIVMWGGRNHEGTFDDDWTDPPRFFALYSDEDFAALPTPEFVRTVCDFRRDVLEDDSHPQVLVLEAV